MKPDLSIKGSSGEDIEFGATFRCPEAMSVWGKLKSTGGSYNWTTKLEASSDRYDFGDGNMQGVYGTVQGANPQKDLLLWASGACSTTGMCRPLKVGAKKIVAWREGADVEDNGKVLVLVARHDFPHDDTAAVVGYVVADTEAYVTVSKQQQDLYVKHAINDRTSASTKWDRHGILSASVTHDSDQYGSTTITYKPEELDLTVTKDGWMAGISTVGQPSVGHFWPVRDGHGQNHDLKVRLNKSMELFGLFDAAEERTEGKFGMRKKWK